MESSLCDGLWHVVMVEHNSMEVMLSLDIEAVVTKTSYGLPHDFTAQFSKSKVRLKTQKINLKLSLNFVQNLLMWKSMLGCPHPPNI